jgi:predicted Zn-dependent protease
VLAPVAIRGLDDERLQVNSQAALLVLGTEYPAYMSDPDVTMLGVTPVDIFMPFMPEWNWVFAAHSEANGHGGRGLISTFHMNPRTYGEPEEVELLEARLRKMVSKYVALLYYDIPESSDPRSITFGPITSVPALDYINKPIPVR